MVGRGLIGSAACLMGLSMPATNAEAGCFTNLFRRSHQQPTVCTTQSSTQYVMGYFYDSQGQRWFGPISAPAATAPAPQAPAQVDPTTLRLLQLEGEIATLRLQVGTVDSNATQGIQQTTDEVDKLDKRTTKLETQLSGAGGSSNPQP